MKEKIIDKIRKLFAQAESEKAIGNEAAAANFAAKVQELLDRHNLSLSDIEIAAAKSGQIEAERVNLILQKIEAWQCHLLQNIAVANGCMSLENEAGYMIVIGRQNDRAVVIEFYNYFERLAWELAENALKAYKEAKKDWYFADREAHFDEFRKSFLIGFALRLSERLGAQHSQDKQIDQNYNPNALVFHGSKARDSINFAFENFQVDDVRETERPTHRQGFNSGTDSGDKVALTNKRIDS